MRSLILILSSAAAIWGQAFEVVSVRPANPTARGSSFEFLPGGKLVAVNVSVRDLLKKAYRIRDFQIANAPAGLDSPWYDVTANAASPVGEGEMQGMLQSLLADRFQLKLRRESKELQVYILTVAKNGPKLNEVAPAAGGAVRIRGVGRLAGLKGSMDQLASALSDVRLNGSAILDRPVVNRTGLNGVYDFSLEWTPEMGVDAADRPGPSIFTAMREQLGLSLEKRNAPVEIFVIEHLEKPSQN